MYVTLIIKSGDRAALPAPQHRFYERGGTVGRDPGSSWVLPDPRNVVSGRHMLVGFSDRQFNVTDTSRNGVFINGSRTPLGLNNTHPLADGDHLRIGDYEIVASVTEDRLAPPASSPKLDAGPDYAAFSSLIDPDPTDGKQADPLALLTLRPVPNAATGGRSPRMTATTGDDDLAGLFDDAPDAVDPNALTADQGATMRRAAQRRANPGLSPPSAFIPPLPPYPQLPDPAPQIGAGHPADIAAMPAPGPGDRVAVPPFPPGIPPGRDIIPPFPISPPAGGAGAQTPGDGPIPALPSFLPQVPATAYAPLPLIDPASPLVPPAQPAQKAPSTGTPARQEPQTTPPAPAVPSGAHLIPDDWMPQIPGASTAIPPVATPVIAPPPAAPTPQPVLPAQPASADANLQIGQQVQPVPARPLPAPPLPPAAPQDLAGLFTPGEAPDPSLPHPIGEPVAPHDLDGLFTPEDRPAPPPPSPPAEPTPPQDLAALFQPEPSPPPHTPVLPVEPAIPQDLAGLFPTASPLAQPPSPAAPDLAPFAAPSPIPSSLPLPSATEPAELDTRAMLQRREAARLVSAPPPADHAPTSDPDEANALWNALDIDAARLPAHDRQRFAAEIGLAMRELADGLIALFAMRQTVKVEFNMEQTVLGADRNNPFKFTRDADELLSMMAANTNRAFLPVNHAVRAAFQDLRSHEAAVLYAVQLSIRALLDRFNPARIEDEVAEGRGRFALGSAKAANWDRFTASWNALAGDADEVASRIFATEFARAYLEQTQRTRNV